MAKIFEGAIKLASTIQQTGAQPLDDRVVVATVNDLYNSFGTAIYNGMLVAVAETGDVYMLKDKTKVGEAAGWKLIGGDTAAGLEGLTGRVKTLEGKHAEGKTVAQEVTDGIEGLDVANNTSDAVKGVTVTVNETDGKVTQPVISIADGTLIGEATDDNLVTGKVVKTYVDDNVKIITDNASKLSGRVTTLEGTVGDETKGLVKDMTVAKSAISTINGDASTPGSFAKGDADTLAAAKKYTDDAKAELIGAENTVGTIKHAEKLATDASDKVDAKIAEEVKRANDAYATAAQGTKADTALQSIEKSGDYINVTEKAGNKQTVSLTTQTISDASTTAKGLAEASDVKGYVDGTKTALIGTDKDAATVDTIKGAKAAAADAKAAANAKISAVTSKTGDKYVKATTDGTAVTIESIGIDGAIGDAKTALIGTDKDAATVDTIKGAKAAAKAADDKAAAAQTAADSKIKSVTGDTTVIANTSTDHAVTVSLKTNDKGNVKFTQDTDGLSANVTIPPATVTGVKAGDKVLALDGTELTSTISLSVDTSADAADGKKYIRLKGIDGADLGKIDIADFVKDGMLDSATLVTNPAGQPQGTYIVLTWNTDGGKDPMYINVTSLIDIYTAKPNGGLTLEDHEFSVDTTVIATKQSVDAEITRAKEAEAAVKTAVKSELIGNTDTDTKDSSTIAGAKKYTDALETKLTNAAVTLSIPDNDPYITASRKDNTNMYTISSKWDTDGKTPLVDVKINTKLTEKINSLVVTDNTSEAVAGIAVTVNETGGKVIKPIVEVTPGSVAAGNANLVTGGTVKTYVDTAITNAALVWNDIPATA